MSAFMQEEVLWHGKSLVFEEASEFIERSTGIKVHAKQVERICTYYGNCMEESWSLDLSSEEQATLEARKDFLMLWQGMDKDDADPLKALFVAVDGSMVQCRKEFDEQGKVIKEAGYRENKLGRLFQTEQDAKGRPKVKKDSSLYVSHRGDFSDFSRKMDYAIGGHPFLVFLGDGAKPIWNWVEKGYPNAIQILDFYHVAEKLGQLAFTAFRDVEAEKWFKEKYERLLDDGIDELITKLEQMDESGSQEYRDRKRQLIGYCQRNRKRMLYGTFRKKGFMIASGPIESAHKFLIQNRLKLSGQQWKDKGVQSVANLRVAKYSERWGVTRFLVEGGDKRLLSVVA